MRESTIEASVCAYAKKQGCLVYKFTSPSQRGVPDRIIVTPNGVVGFLELKAPGQKPTTLQIYELERLRAKHARVHWVDNVEDGKAFVDLLLELNP